MGMMESVVEEETRTRSHAVSHPRRTPRSFQPHRQVSRNSRQVSRNSHPHKWVTHLFALAICAKIAWTIALGVELTAGNWASALLACCAEVHVHKTKH